MALFCLQRGSRPLLGLLLTLCLLGACDREPVRQEEQDDGVASRALTFQPEEGRLVGVEWADVSTPSSRKQRTSAVRRSAIEAIDNPEERRTIGQLRGDAVVALMNGELDQAIAGLSRAAELAPANAVVLSDLAAARLQRGTAFSNPYDFVLALSAAHRAVQLAPNLLAAAYNRALALQRLSLDRRAREEWRLYLQLEPDPSWQNAAQAHATALSSSSAGPAPEDLQATVRQAAKRGDQQRVQEMAADSPRDLREYAEQELLGAWAEATAQQRTSEAQTHLDAARAIGAALAATNGEHMVADTVAHIDQLQTTAPQAVSQIAEALQSYQKGFTLIQEGDPERARPLLEAAHRLLTEPHSPFAGWATYQAAVCHYQHADYDGAQALLRPLLQDPAHSRHAALQARAHWLEGLIAIIRGDPIAALTAYEAALTTFQNLGEHSHAARMAGQVAVVLDVLGRRGEAWQRLQPALLEPSTYQTPFSRRSLCTVAASLAKADGELEIALWFQEEVVQSALAQGIAYPAAAALRGSSEILAALGRTEEAARDAARARQQIAAVPDPNLRQLLEGDLLLVEAQLAEAPQEKLPLLDGALRIFRATTYRYQLAGTLFERSRAHEALGDSAAAERDLKAAIEQLEGQRERIGDPEARIGYFDRAREILDTMLLLQLEQLGQPETAFRYSEQAKSRALLDWVVAHPFGEEVPAAIRPATSAATPDVFQRELPEGTTIIEYSVLPRSLVIWVLRRDRFAVETVPVAPRDLEGRIRRLTRAMALEQRAATRTEASGLREILLRPVEKHLAPGDRLVIVPDRALHRVPFAALYEARTRRYLIEDRVLSIAPSARLLLASLRRDEELTRRRAPRALVLVDPAFDQAIFPDLDRLQAARREANAANFFPGSRVLIDRDATREAFLQSAGDYEIVHFGGHSVMSSSFPLLSQMLFASHPNDPSRGILYSGDLLDHRFEHTRLAVLASCSTAAGRISRTEGVQSLARPFLAAGVPTVIASLWDVEDETTAQLFGRFYRHLREAFDPATALQQAQIESLRQGLDPWAWGAFEVIGASSPGR